MSFQIVGQAINMRYLAANNGYTEKEPEDWQRIVRIVEFGLKYGYKAAIDGFIISKSTYYNYLKLYNLGKQINTYIEFKSKRPLKIRKAQWDKRIVNFICKMRSDHPNIGKGKIKYYLDEYCLANNINTISTGTIQNIINSYPHKLRTKKSISYIKRKRDVLRKPSGYKPKKSGECTSLDSMEFRCDGKKLYVVVVQDEATNLLYAEATTSHTSRSTKAILDNAYNYLPYSKFTTILTDNGCEFQKDFAAYLQQQNITHYHTYPKSPKQNARCERVNRTIQDEFMIKYGNLLFDDIHLFNKKLNEYLHWFNFKRVHYRFGNKMTPFQYHLHITQQHTVS